MIAPGQVGRATDFSGLIMMWAASSIPSGWFECNGQAVSRSTYSFLFGIIGTTYGVGNGTTTFNVPDFRSSSPVGAGQKTETRIAIAAYSAVDTSTDLITTTNPHFLNSGDQVSLSGSTAMPRVFDPANSGNVSVDASGNIPIGSLPLPTVGDAIYVTFQSSTNFSVGTIYWVITASGGSFTVSATPGGSIFGSGNSGSMAFSMVPLASAYNSNTYYVSRVSSTTVKLSTSLANMIGGTYMDIMVQGASGNLTLTTPTITHVNRTIGEIGGEEDHQLSVDEMPNHTHIVPYSAVTNTIASGGSGDGYRGVGTTPVGYTGGSKVHNNMSPFTVVKFIIKT